MAFCARVHPVNDIVNRACRRPSSSLLAIRRCCSPALCRSSRHTPFFSMPMYAGGFGPLRGVFASPTFHRWHHTSAEEGRDKTSRPCCRCGTYGSALTICREDGRSSLLFRILCRLI